MSELVVLCAMLDQLDEPSLVELERAILLTLHVAETPSERRIAELGFLASLLAKQKRRPNHRAAYIERDDYDRLRPPEAPLSARLIERYGSFRAACWHAYGLLEDGRWLGPSRPWPTVGVGEYRVRAYSREEVLDSIRQCARELRLTTINSTDYFRWLAAKRRNARLQGREIRLAGQTAIYRHFPVSSGGWNAAVRAAMEDGGR